MQAVYRAVGESIDHTPEAAIAAGQVVVLGDHLVTAAKVDCAAGDLGALSTQGVYDVVKDDSDLAAGDAVYWDDDGDPVGGESGSGAFSGDPTAGPFAGWALHEAGSGEGTVRIYLRSVDGTLSDTLGLADLTDVDTANTSSGRVLVANGTKYAGVAVSGDVTLNGSGVAALNAAHEEQVYLIPIENLAAGADIADRPVFAPPRAGVIRSAALLAQGSYAGVDAGNTMVVLLETGSDAICSKTFNNTTVPTDGGVDDLGTISAHGALDANEIVLLSITNGTTADPPALLLRIVFAPTNAA